MVRQEAAAAEEQYPAAAGSPAWRLFALRGSASTAGARPRVPPEHGRAPRPRAPRLLSGAGGGAEAGAGAEASASGAGKGARSLRLVPATLARAAWSPDEP